MEWGIKELVIICPLVFLAGFVDAIAGGGGLISLPAHLIAGLPVHFAIGTNKMSAVMGTTLATARYALKGYIPWKLSAFCVVSALVGSALGAEAALMLSDYIFKIVMLVILPLTAVYVLRGNGLSEEKEPYGTLRTTAISMGIAFVIGAYDGFYGPGTGTFLILLLMGCAHLTLQKANGTSKAINLTTNISAMTVFLLNDKVIVPLALIAGLFNLAGSYFGSRSFEIGGAKVVRPIMCVVLAIFFVRVISDLLF
ncbi:MAG: sulfite exporter TauE/SafE family protein [Fretibacterium sp.]|nr:sulfite exporter TauE/SafE family protein [Fretibacterium sp.]